MPRYSNSQLVDRSLGLAVTVTGTIAVAYALKWLHDALRRRDAQPRLRNEEEQRRLDELARPPHNTHNTAPSHNNPPPHNTHSSHNTNSSHNTSHSAEKVVHSGGCHCQRVQFRVFAPAVLTAVDCASSQLRFPRIPVRCEDFELLSDPDSLSTYAVRLCRESGREERCEHINNNYNNSVNAFSGHFFDSNNNNNSHYMNNNNNNNNINGNSIIDSNEDENVGVYFFCSFCGTHVLYAPSAAPTEVHVNAHTLSLAEEVPISPHSTSYAHTQSHTHTAPTHTLLQRRTQSHPRPSLSMRERLPAVPEESSAPLTHSHLHSQHAVYPPQREQYVAQPTHPHSLSHTYGPQSRSSAYPHHTNRPYNTHNSSSHNARNFLLQSYRTMERDRDSERDSESLNSIDSAHDPLLFSHNHYHQTSLPQSSHHANNAHSGREFFAAPHSPSPAHEDLFTQYYVQSALSLTGETDRDDRYSVPSPVPSDSGESSSLAHTHRSHHTHSRAHHAQSLGGFSLRETHRRSRHFGDVDYTHTQSLGGVHYSSRGSSFTSLSPSLLDSDAVPSADVSPLSASHSLSSLPMENNSKKNNSNGTSGSAHTRANNNVLLSPAVIIDHKSTHINLRRHLGKHRHSTGSIQQRQQQQQQQQQGKSDAASAMSMSAPASPSNSSTSLRLASEADLLLGVL